MRLSVPALLARLSLVGFSLSVPAVGQDLVQVGSRGVAVDLADQWFTYDLMLPWAADQFMGKGPRFGHALAILELERTLDDQAAYERMFVDLASEISSTYEKWTSEPVTFEEGGDAGFDHAHTSAISEIQGLKLAYEFHLLGYEDLGYVLMMWGPLRDAEKLRAESSRIASSFQLPDQESEWGASRELLTHTARTVSGHRIRLELASNLFHELPPHEDFLFSFSTPSEDFGVYVLEAEAEFEAAKAGITSLMRAEFPAHTYRDIGAARVAGRRSHEAVLTDGTETFRLFIVELDPDTCLDLRLLSSGGADAYAALRRTVLDALRIEDPPSVPDAFPQPVPIDAPVESPRWLDFLAAGKRLATLRSFPGQVERSEQGLLLSSAYEGVALWREGAAEVESLYGGSLQLFPSASLRSGTLEVLSDEGEVFPVVNGIPGEGRETAGAWAALRERECAYTSAAAAPRPGLALMDGASRTSLVWERGTRRREIKVSGRIAQLTASAQGDELLALIAPAYSLEFSGDSFSFPGDLELRVFDMRSGESRSLGNWHYITTIGPAPSGWLITGRPFDAVRGVWHQRSDGTREVLVTFTRVAGLELGADDRVLLAVASAPDALGVAGTELWEFDIASARLHGALEPHEPAAFEALCSEALAAVGLSAKDARNPGTEAEVRALATAIDAACAAAGLPSISRVDELDALVNGVSGQPGTGLATQVGLAALLSRCLLDGGAVWVESSDAPPDSTLFAGQRLPSNVFAQAYVPLELVVMTGMGATSWWSPASTVVDDANGRTILIGPDAAALRAEVERRGRELQNLGEATNPTLDDLLDSAPKNTYLRSIVYAALADVGRFDDAERLAARFAQAGSASGVDTAAWLGSRVARGEAPVPELQQAIARYPAALELHLLLAQCYENADPPDRLRARAAYQHAYSNGWGWVESMASEGLDRLDE